jgi:hypothetical protein
MSDISQLNIYGQELKQRFQEELTKLGLPSKIVPFDYLVGERRFLGLWNGPMVAEIVRINDPRLIFELGITSLFGRGFVIAQDQAIDQGKTDLVPLIPVMLNRFLTGIRALTGGSIENDVNKIIEESALDNLADIAQRQRPFTVTICDLGKIGRKTKIAVIPGLAATVMANQPGLKELMTNITYRYLVAIQIADDLADMDDDEANNHFTAVSLLYRRCGLEPIYEYANKLLTSIVEDLVSANPGARQSIDYFCQVRSNMATAFTRGTLIDFSPELIQATDL